MFFEKLDFRVDIERLRDAVTNNVFSLGDPIIQGEEYGYQNFGGWSILSQTGDWRDGWVSDVSKLLERNGKIPSHLVPKIRKYIGASVGFEHCNPTQACVGEVASVIDTIRQKGFYPRQARVSMLRPGGKTIIHKDADEDSYLARIHIPLWTSEECIHSCDGYDLHMPADGSVYMLWVNRIHQVFNNSKQNRYHIIMDAFDTKHITKQFHYDGDINVLQQEAEEFRQDIIETWLTEEEEMFFDEMKKKLT